MTRRLIAIDPGETTGWASFYDRVLINCGTVVGSPPQLPGIDEGDDQLWGPVDVVIEKPVSYPMDKVDANDLITLAITVGEWKEFLGRWAPGVELVKPRTWKGTVPKTIHNDRIVALLTAEEKALMPKRPRAKTYDHNMLDAVGIGLWKLQRSRR